MLLNITPVTPSGMATCTQIYVQGGLDDFENTYEGYCQLREASGNIVLDANFSMLNVPYWDWNTNGRLVSHLIELGRQALEAVSGQTITII